MAVFKRGKVWWYDFRFRGSRIRESTKVTTRAAAIQAEALRKTELASGQVRAQKPEPSPRFTDFAYGEFSQWCANEHKDHPSTYSRYMRSVKVLVGFFGTRTLDLIDPGLVERFKLHRSQQPRKQARNGRLVSPAAVNRDMAVLRILFNLAVRLGKATRNPVTGIRFFPETAQHMRVLTAAEEERYLQAASPSLRDLALVMLETGMRPGEVFQLRKPDVDLSLGTVSIRHGKTRSARRHIPLTRLAQEVLRARIESEDTEWLFPNPLDPTKPIQRLNHAHEVALRRSGIMPPFRLYDLRHTALSRMAMAGIDLPTLKEIAGHSQIQMTMRYIHPSPEHKRRAIDKLERFREELHISGQSRAAGALRPVTTECLKA